MKVVWTREDDIRGGWYRPMWYDRMVAGIDAQGNPVAWTHTIVGQSIIAGTAFEPFIIKDGIDGTSVEGAADLLYGIPNLQVDLHTPKIGVFFPSSRMTAIVMPASSGRPGPGEITIRSAPIAATSATVAATPALA